MQIEREQYGFDGKRTFYHIKLDNGLYVSGSVKGRQNLSKLIRRDLDNIEHYGTDKNKYRLRELLREVE